MGGFLLNQARQSVTFTEQLRDTAPSTSNNVSTQLQDDFSDSLKILVSSDCKFPPWLKSDKSLLSKDLNLSLTVFHNATNLTISKGERSENMKCVTNSEDGDEEFKAVFETKTDW